MKIFNFCPIKKYKNLIFCFCLLLLVAIGCGSTANAYELLGYKWTQPSTSFHVDIPGADDLWNDAFEGAMYEWSNATVFQFYIVRDTYSDPCNSSDDRNGVRFDSTDCGDAWGDTTLAITHTWYIGSMITETDIVFNSNVSWDVYSTSWSSYPWNGVNDFRRVAVHELGHVIGLGHEDSGVSTIMNTYVDDTTIPQQDDINGVNAIYGSTPCTYSLSPTGKSVTSAGTSSSIYVTTSSNCSWTSSESLSWVTITSGSVRTGSGSVYYTVFPNTTPIQRNGTITVAGKSFIITQSPAPLIIYYRDMDGDGYGDPHRTTQAWSLPNGYVENNLDCNDNDKFIYPEATEIRGDGIDQDCNGSDLPPVNTYYQDGDGDGYGNPNMSTEAEVQPEGYVTNSMDCNDENSDINPEAVEYCNGVDENCNGVTDETCDVVPNKPTLIALSGVVEEARLVFRWNELPNASWYKIYLLSPSNGYKFVQWYETEDNNSDFPEVTCSTGECSVTLDSALENGPYEWFIRGWNENGNGDWSNGMSFTIQGNDTPPSKVTHTSPTGTTQTSNPTFTWHTDSESTWYKLWVGYNSTDKIFAQWYGAAEICSGDTCSVSSDLNLLYGDYEWYVKSWNDYGKIWSDGMSFSLEE